MSTNAIESEIMSNGGVNGDIAANGGVNHDEVTQWGTYPLHAEDNSGLYDLSGVLANPEDGGDELTNYEVLMGLAAKMGYEIGVDQVPVPPSPYGLSARSLRSPSEYNYAARQVRGLYHVNMVRGAGVSVEPVSKEYEAYIAS